MNHKFNLKDRVVFIGKPATVIEVRFCEAGIYYVIKLDDKQLFITDERNLSKPFTIHDFIAAADAAWTKQEYYDYTFGDRRYYYESDNGAFRICVTEPRRTLIYATRKDFLYHHEQDFV